jgi:ABC-type transport system involved in multi-copper enzyme maturation permease subunit
MRMRWGLGPVFFYEWLTASRRWQLYAIRAVFVAILLGALSLVWISHLNDMDDAANRRMLAQIGEQFFYAIVGTQMALVLLAAPAATAGSICIDKARGTLLHVLVTDLSDPEIVLGKLGARLMPVLGLLLAALPVLFLGVLLGGIDPEALLGAFLVTLGVAVFGCALALTLSVWGTKTHEVLLAVYGIWVVVLLAYPVWMIFTMALKTAAPPQWIKWMDPFITAFAPYLYPGTTAFEESLTFLAVAAGLSAALIGLAIWRIRSVTVRQSNRPHRERRHSRWAFPLWNLTGWLPGPSLNGNPVMWREWRRRRPSTWARIIWLTYAILAIGFSVLAILLGRGSNGMGQPVATMTNALQLAVGFLLLSVGAVTVLAEERVRGSLDVLLTTPLSTWSIVWGKWWGAFRRVPFMAVLPVGLIFWFTLGNDASTAPLPPGFAARGRPLPYSLGSEQFTMAVTAAVLMGGFVLGCGAAITSLGLAIATWISRFGRAIGLCVTMYVLGTVAWPILVGILSSLFQTRGTGQEGMMMASPFFGPGMMTEYFVRSYRYLQDRDILSWTIAWIVVDFAVAIGLFLATLLTFDKCLGRITKRGPSLRRADIEQKRARQTIGESAPSSL